MVLKVGYVPEHFSTPIHFAQTKGFFAKHNLEVELVPYPSGSGHLIQSLEDSSLDIAIGLTEAFIRGVAQGKESYRMVGTYVQSPLCWAISTGYERDELTKKEDLQGKTVGISRLGSGSHVMSFVLALQENFGKPAFKDFVILDNFEKLRNSVNLKEGVSGSDAFMWEYFTSKRYYDNKEIKKIGEIYTPWPSWVINARVELFEKGESEVELFLKALDEGVQHFKHNTEESIKYIYENLNYSEEDAREWIKTVEFSDDLNGLDWKIVEGCYKVLIEAGVLTDTEDVIVGRLNELISRK